jgi:hypothetical protein
MFSGRGFKSRQLHQSNELRRHNGVFFYARSLHFAKSVSFKNPRLIQLNALAKVIHVTGINTFYRQYQWNSHPRFQLHLSQFI